MKRTYFKHRHRFDFSQYTFDIGRPLFWPKEFEDNHVLYRLYHLKESDYPAFYKYHLEYFLTHNENGQEQKFFQHLYSIISDALDELKVKGRYNSNHGTDVKNKEVLKEFMDFMKSIDQWKTDKSKDTIIAEQQEEILKLKSQLGEAKLELKDARKLETADYINIADGYRNTLLDLYLQLQEIKLPNGKELLLSQTQSVWMKMICKYFRRVIRRLILKQYVVIFPVISENRAINTLQFLQNPSFIISAMRKSTVDFFFNSLTIANSQPQYQVDFELFTT